MSSSSLLLFFALAAPAFAQSQDLAGFRSRLMTATTKHLDLLLDANGNVAELKGKSSETMTASAYYLMYERTGNPKYRAAAVQLAGRIGKSMKATKFGVLYIKEKDKGEGKVIPGGGPPAFGWYVATTAWIYGREGGHEAELRYIAKVLDEFPWNEQGWWSADIDVRTGESKQPMTKESPINKNAAMVVAAYRVSEAMSKIDPALSRRLKAKADQCLYRKILPLQEPDGYWHYGMNGNDPKNKDILGYFMVTMDALIQVRHFSGFAVTPDFTASMARAAGFAGGCIAPMTDPNKGAGCKERSTPNTPAHYDVAEDPRRGFQLGLTLIGSGNYKQGIPIVDETLKNFPYGNAGSDGSHAVHPCSLMLALLPKQ